MAHSRNQPRLSPSGFIGGIGTRTPARKREVNPAKNRVWDSSPILAQALRSDSEERAKERAMYVISIVFGLTAASLANVVCLYGYL
jgi:hypothetical protein